MQVLKMRKKNLSKDLIEKFPNTVYLGTFSKAYALGGMRVGYGLAKEDIISNFIKLELLLISQH